MSRFVGGRRIALNVIAVIGFSSFRREGSNLLSPPSCDPHRKRRVTRNGPQDYTTMHPPKFISHETCHHKDTKIYEELQYPL